jgi:hypothetical protein
VDLNQLRTRLGQLGVTLKGDDDPPALAAVLPDQRIYRASLYLPRLEAARDFLATLSGPVPAGLGLGYDFVRTALESKTLIDALALELDHWVVPAVEHALVVAQPAPKDMAGYQGYFTSNILNASDAGYQANVDNFFRQYPITDNALTKITGNFQDNIKTACRRIIDDESAIRDLFKSQYPGLALHGLTAIKSTGSDSHKGGQQVLILTFAATWLDGRKQRRMDLRVVYKPADLEVDCLLVGDSAAVNAAAPGFQDKSLTEIFNDQVRANRANPVADRESLPTYRILPRKPTSATANPPWPVRDAYGYIEFLGHETSYSFQALNFYLGGTSDFVIFNTKDEQEIIPRCYRQMGQWLAVACTFSLQDLHLENVRISKYQPYLIDLEVSLAQPVETSTETALLTNVSGGFTGEWKLSEPIWVVELPKAGQPGQGIQFTSQQTPRYLQNRLWTQRLQGRNIVPVNPYWLLIGLTNGMNVLAEIQAADGFAAWFARLSNTLVRVLPFATSDWYALRGHVYGAAVASNPAPVALAQTLQDDMRLSLTDEFRNYTKNPTPQPRFMVYAAQSTANDLQDFDIPAFYHRIGHYDLLDSTGTAMLVPAQVVVNDPNTPSLTISPDTNVGRTSYFAGLPTLPPTAAYVQPQVAELSDLTAFNRREEALREEAMKALNVLVPPTSAGELIP